MTLPDAQELEQQLRELLATVADRDLAGLLDDLLGPASPTWPRFRDAPAAKRLHHARRHGLLEHSLLVAQGVAALAAIFPRIDRDLALTGALLHDVGKLDTYVVVTQAGEEGERETIELTDAGRLQGEIVLGSERVRAAIGARPGFPPERAEQLLHIVLSHHGTLAHGSPVVPVTREATLVHMVDNIGGKLGSFDRLEQELPDGERWSGWDRAIGSSAWFPPTKSRK
ncbi:HD domain-containing protein [Conexibacter sp. JD483]|uniref:HD domain-containing protein n=1 Tax=unclassified Conexibacter TaxID=2627773 RepID=UPI002726D881|nr:MULTISPECIES: HD domain-containing protein [unclassified Conexibacter]MDO8184257.1 HD domain-containing protein [Conexibacter sp. CPCC 205706]MDO8197563.1 HD domain-containing protein [Conexibacter sp. CPCC 205762]MDR9371060.1 HD domain-containing protein [Conexibacter sp. JD483]